MMQHIVHSFDQELKFLTTKIVAMIDHSEQMITNALQAMINNDVDLAKKIITDDEYLDQAEREIDDRAITIIAKRQPMADDLREIVGAIRISSDLERVGDMAKNIAKRVGVISMFHQDATFYKQIKELTNLALAQLAQVRDIYAQRNVAQITDVLKRDEEIDTVYTNLFRYLVEVMGKDKEKITLCTHLLFCAKNIERVGDHATNIVEMIHYIVTARHPALDRVRKDLTHQVKN